MDITSRLPQNPSNEYFDFVFTNDGSTGLYNYAIKDIYHSVFGAKQESYEKFVIPLNFEKNFLDKKNLKVLDICYGIGYNTKALLKKVLQTGYKGSVDIDILEYDKNLVTLSPFIKDEYFENSPEISYIILSSLMSEVYGNKNSIINILSKSANKKFFEPFYRELIKKYRNFGYSYDPGRQNNSFLHNIYYHCISQRNKMASKTFKINKFSITPYFDDARKTIKELNGVYDIIFLDAFTPDRLPTLWTLEFFKELYRLADKNSILVTYSKSCSVRHAMIECGFSAGKLFDRQNRSCGTVASKNSDLIKNKLNEYDIGLIKTNAGIYYTDENLNSSPEEIKSEREKRKKELNLESSSQFIRRFKEMNRSTQ